MNTDSICVNQKGVAFQVGIDKNIEVVLRKYSLLQYQVEYIIIGRYAQETKVNVYITRTFPGAFQSKSVYTLLDIMSVVLDPGLPLALHKDLLLPRLHS